MRCLPQNVAEFLLKFFSQRNSYGLASIVALFALAPLPSQGQDRNSPIVTSGLANVVEGPVQAGGILATIPMTHARPGILRETVQLGSYRMQAGTPIYQTAFGKAGFESVTAWCGVFEVRPLLTWTDYHACIVDTPNGASALAPATSLRGPAAGWFVEKLNLTQVSKPFPRPRIESSSEDGQELSLRWALAGIVNGQATLQFALIGPSGSKDPSEIELGRIRLDLMSGPKVFDSMLDGKGGAIELSLSGPSAVSAKLVDPAQHASSVKPAPIMAATPEASVSRTEPTRSMGTDFVINGVYLLPAKMQASSSQVQKGGVLLSGPARFWETASLTYQFFHQSRVGATVTASPGTRLQKVEVIARGPLGLRETKTYWCGSFDYQAMGIRLPMAHCLRQENIERVELSQVGVRGTPLVFDASRMITREVLLAKNFDLTSGSSTTPNDLEVEVVLSNLTKSAVEVTFRGGRNGVANPFLSLRLPLTENGTAELPFWTHTLSLKRQEGGIAAQWQENSPGLGPVAYGLELADQRR